MLDGGVSRRYSRALFDVAVGSGAVDSVEQELKSLVPVLTGSGSAKGFWNSLTIQADEKKAAVDAAFKGKGVSDTIVNFLKVVIDKGRESSLESMLTEYSKLADDFRRIQDVDVRTALPLSESATDKIRTSMEAKLDRKVRLSVTVEPELIGGLVIRIGDRVMDGSVATRLESLKRTMVSNT